MDHITEALTKKLRIKIYRQVSNIRRTLAIKLLITQM